MRLVSTRNASVEATFAEAVFAGLAPDGGLYVPAKPPVLRRIFSRFTPESSFLDIAIELTQSLLGDELGSEEAEEICRTAFGFAPEISPLEPGIELLELYHGPSYAFKDFGAAFLAASMAKLLERADRRAVILTATSGDTGSAVAHAFAGREAIEVVILYPRGRVSPLQEKQLTTIGGNVHALEVEGAFDDCQRMVKEAFLDEELRESLPLTSANSISIGRLLPQAFYYAFAASRAPSGGGPPGPPVFCVPSGNFGNLTAGLLARQWGMECRGFIAATNANDVVPEYLSTSRFAPRASVATWSNAMDVGNPSNFERLVSMFGGDHDAIARVVAGITITDEETIAEMRSIHRRTGKFLCPHTAVGTLAARRYRESHREHRIVSLATAHPAKFTEVIERATGVRPPLPEGLAKAFEREKHATVIAATLDGLREFLHDTMR